MSTVLYAYRCPKLAWWDVAQAVRHFYLETWPFLDAVRNQAEELIAKEGVGANLMVGYERVEKLFADLSAPPHEGRLTVELQVFDESEYHYLIRPLEWGWYFLNNCEQWPSLTQIYYDTRADPEPGMEANGPAADWVDKQIRQHRYFLYPVVEKDDYIHASMAFDLLKKKEAETD